MSPEVIIVCFIALVVLHLWLHITNPYSRISIVKLPYNTNVVNGSIVLSKNFDLRVYGSKFAQLLGYYKSGFLIVQNTYFGSRRAKAPKADGIIRDIHALRFDPSKPYLISGDQFSVLYTRNLGVFYNSLLNPHTALDKPDWERRQRVYLQSALYALDAFSKADTLATTLVPIGPRSVLLTQVHPGSVPSDTLYGLLYALQALQDKNRYPARNGYALQTTETVMNIVVSRQKDLRRLLDCYLRQVQDRQTGLIRRGLNLASARDGVVRDCSFYDNVILWKTLSLAQSLGIIPISNRELGALRRRIFALYWDDKAGHFRDDLSDKQSTSNYSSDWLIALPAGFLNPADAKDHAYLDKCIAYIRREHIDKPFPLKYQATNSEINAPWAVRTFVPNYGGDAIWSYWGAQYITLLAQMGHQRHNKTYLREAREYRAIYRQKMEQYHGFPETFDADGDFLQNAAYKSIRQTGWVVQFEEAGWHINQHG